MHLLPIFIHSSVILIYVLTYRNQKLTKKLTKKLQIRRKWYAHTENLTQKNLQLSPDWQSNPHPKTCTSLEENHKLQRPKQNGNRQYLSDFWSFVCKIWRCPTLHWYYFDPKRLWSKSHQAHFRTFRLFLWSSNNCFSFFFFEIHCFLFVRLFWFLTRNWIRNS